MKHLLNTGISEHNDEGLNRKIKLHNLIVLFISLAALSYVPMHLYFRLYSLMSITASFLLVALLCYLLQHRKKHLAAFSLLTFSMVALMSLISIVFGQIAHIHFFLLCACMTSIVFFDGHKKLLVTAIALSLSYFFLLLLFLPYSSELAGRSFLLTSVLKFYGYFNFLILFAFITLFFTVFVRQNASYQKKILTQNSILEQKNGRITDSINYARHIQDAILPSPETVRSVLEDSFILFRPKDIVAGDFYWLHQLDEQRVLFAAADSTGHGVPGAMLSVVCTNALNRAVKEFGLSEPGQILDKVRELIGDSFRHSAGHEIKDGMDISLCLIDKEQRSLEWAGANNPLWIIRENKEELMVIPADKQSVSRTDEPRPFTTHHIALNPGDCFYLFTDGYADQFGGPRSKKYMQKRMKKLLMSMYRKTMSVQLKLMNDNLVHWMGNLEQVDDICVIGVRM